MGEPPHTHEHRGTTMVELGNTLTEDARWLVDFVRGTGGAVVASNSGTGAPESAYVLVAATDAGKIVFGTNAQSRKFTNITSDPRVSMVLVQDGAHEVQLEGEARVLEGSDAAPATEALAAQHPGSTDTRDPENLRVVEVTVRWASRTDTTHQPPLAADLDLR
ncbi:pyridoxamine 5'-phosphate oxidase family protein [Kocuria sp. UBA5001]|uniref:pyridoxamine 5'-phosphate oxidase family protein n=1 Tax=Kocuria sp. UBA5001 TaxID=1946674 RepID=UPI0025C26BE8|nr:pyridoxamine 5'-phosphate oxidase family protein [Kocuria sp. UBA5001]